MISYVVLHYPKARSGRTLGRRDARWLAARDRKPDVPMHPLRSSDIALVRYIGHPTLELNGPLLDDWAKRVASWLNEGTEVYFFCHCPDERRSPALCREFQHRLEHLADVSSLPWDEQDGGMQQASLF